MSPRFRSMLVLLLNILFWSVVLGYGAQNPSYFTAAIVSGAICVILFVVNEFEKGKAKAVALSLGPFAQLYFIACAALVLFTELTWVTTLGVIGLSAVSRAGIGQILNFKGSAYLLCRGFVLDQLAINLWGGLTLAVVVYFQSIAALSIWFVLLGLTPLWMALDRKYGRWLSKLRVRLPRQLERKDVISCYMFCDGKMFRVFDSKQPDRGIYLQYNDTLWGHGHLAAYGDHPVLGDAGVMAALNKEFKVMVFHLSDEAKKRISIKSLRDCSVCSDLVERGYPVEEMSKQNGWT